MSKRAPSTKQLLVIAGFALSCFGILLFLWITFGGPTPFKAKPYEIKIPFNEATQLAEQSDVRDLRRRRRQSAEHRPGTQPQAGAGDDLHRRQVRAVAALDQGHPPHQDPARRDLRRTDARQPQRPQAPRRRHPSHRAGRTVGPAGRDLPHLQPEDPRRLPVLDAGSRRRDRRPAAHRSPPRSGNSTRPSPNSTGSSASSTPSASRSASCSATVRSPSRRCAAVRGSWRA